MPQKHPEKLLSVAEIVFLTGFHKNTVLKEIVDGELRARAKKLLGEWRVPVSTYNTWVEAGEVALK